MIFGQPRGILSPLRLPISPRPHGREIEHLRGFWPDVTHPIRPERGGNRQIGPEVESRYSPEECSRFAPKRKKPPLTRSKGPMRARACRMGLGGLAGSFNMPVECGGFQNSSNAFAHRVRTASFMRGTSLPGSSSIIRLMSEQVVLPMSARIASRRSVE